MNLEYKMVYLNIFVIISIICLTACHGFLNKSAIQNNNILKNTIINEYNHLPNYVKKDIRYAAAFYDLDGDNHKEVLVYVFGSRVCGSSGCNTYILKQNGSQYYIVSTLANGFLPIRVLSTTSNGWQDLAIRVAGGGITTPYSAQLSFNGMGYPENPTVGPATKVPEGSGNILIDAPPQGPQLFGPSR